MAISVDDTDPILGISIRFGRLTNSAQKAPSTQKNVTALVVAPGEKYKEKEGNAASSGLAPMTKAAEKTQREHQSSVKKN